MPATGLVAAALVIVIPVAEPVSTRGRTRSSWARQAGHTMAGGWVLQRARSNAADGQPLEIQLLEFPSTAALDAYMNDGRRLSLSHDRDRAIARTQIIDVELIQPH
jgi:hypothetical protein